MIELLFWLYFINLALLILHEMDSAYGKEWDLFRLQGGFLLIHPPLGVAGAIAPAGRADDSVVLMTLVSNRSLPPGQACSTGRIGK
jgi:hypothetical protein